MIDLHTHVLPGVDDGPPSVEDSVSLARAARAAGTETIVATPHVRDDYPLTPERIARARDDLEAALAAAGVEIRLEGAAEVAIPRIDVLGDEELSQLCLGAGPYLLVESPYTAATDGLEHALFDLQLRGFQPVLAHPERSPSFIRDLGRLERIVGRGVRCSVTASSMRGRFGRTVRGVVTEMFERRLVHNVASDAHDLRHRPPGLRSAFDELGEELPGLAAGAAWFVDSAPAAMLAGADPGDPPDTGRARSRRGARLRRLLGRR